MDPVLVAKLISAAVKIAAGVILLLLTAMPAGLTVTGEGKPPPAGEADERKFREAVAGNGLYMMMVLLAPAAVFFLAAMEQDPPWIIAASVSVASMAVTAVLLLGIRWFPKPVPGNGRHAIIDMDKRRVFVWRMICGALLLLTFAADYAVTMRV